MRAGAASPYSASALLGLLPGNAQTAGSALLGSTGPAAVDAAVELLTATERQLAGTLRGRRIGLIPQSPAAHLTPVRTIRSQLEETVREVTRVPRAALRAAAERAAGRASLPLDHLDRYPHQLSGGLAQRAATALALVGDAPCCWPTSPPPGSTASSSTAPSTSSAGTWTTAMRC